MKKINSILVKMSKFLYKEDAKLTWASFFRLNVTIQDLREIKRNIACEEVLLGWRKLKLVGECMIPGEIQSEKGYLAMPGRPLCRWYNVGGGSLVFRSVPQN